MSEPDLPARIGKYEILSILGQGGMGVVYKARDPFLDRIVAIKTIHFDSDESSKDLVARLTMEAKSAGRLHHPNIVTIFDFGSDGDLTYLVMEYVEGKNLASVIGKRLPVQLSKRLEMIIQLCNALTYAHEVGVTHRDIKPANICLTSKEVPKLLDFGLARFDETRLTRSGFTSGTVAYMSPERMRGADGPSDDVFAMTIVAYEFLTYTNAFPGKTYGEIVSKILSDKFPVPPSRVAVLPSQLDPIFARALKRDPKDRYPSAADFARELDRFRLSPEFAAFATQEVQGASPAQGLMTHSSGDHPYSAPEAAEVVEDQTFISDGMKPKIFDGFHFAQTSKSVQIPAPIPAPAASPDEKLPTQAFDLLRHTLPAVASKKSAPAPEPVSTPDPTKAVPRPLRKEPTPDPTVAVPRPQPLPTEASGTILTRFAEKLRQRPGESPVVEATTLQKMGAARLTGELLPLGIAIAAAPLLSRLAGPVGYLAGYAVATILWFRFLKRVDGLRLRSVLVLAVLLRVMTLTTTPSLERSGIPKLTGEPAVSAVGVGETEEPVAPLAYVLAVVASSFGGVILWRLVLMAADLTMVWFLWDPQRPRLALSWATFPFIVLAGFWRGHVELLAAAVLMAAFLWARQDHEATGGLAFGVAAGFTPFAFTTLPTVGDVAVRIERLFVAIVVLLSLVYLLGGRSAVITPLSSVARSSVTLSAAGQALAGAIDSTGVVPSTRHVAESAMNRAGLEKSTIVRWRDRISPRSMAIIVMLLAAWIMLTMVSKRSAGPEQGMSNCVGLFLIAAVNLNPANWLLAVPFALMARQRSWI
ncbi:MAG TPA: protein kinase, partial [Thermoanaerobaculia bacterium]|nr:protein kinase [Thermoanaerobaculia bacterium]